jgi:hypothetical protein
MNELCIRVWWILAISFLASPDESILAIVPLFREDSRFKWTPELESSRKRD